MSDELTYASALEGRKTRLAAIGVGSFGLGELFARHLATAMLCLLVALVLIAGRDALARRCGEVA